MSERWHLHGLVTVGVAVGGMSVRAPQGSLVQLVVGHRQASNARQQRRLYLGCRRVHNPLIGTRAAAIVDGNCDVDIDGCASMPCSRDGNKTGYVMSVR